MSERSAVITAQTYHVQKTLQAAGILPDEAYDLMSAIRHHVEVAYDQGHTVGQMEHATQRQEPDRTSAPSAEQLCRGEALRQAVKVIGRRTFVGTNAELMREIVTMAGRFEAYLWSDQYQPRPSASGDVR
jgi:hypothetical protein